MEWTRDAVGGSARERVEERRSGERRSGEGQTGGRRFGDDLYGKGPQVDSGFFRIAAMHEALQQLRQQDEMRTNKAATERAGRLAREAARRASDRY